MPLDGLTLGFLANELQCTLVGARVERVTQPEKDMLLLALRNNGQNYKLILSASPSFARVHLTSGQFVNPVDAPMFCMLMRKHLSGGRLLEISQLNGDRVLLLRFESQDELGVMHPYEMYLEIMGRHSNLTLVRDGRIIDAIRHVTDGMSRVRQALPGLAYILPPSQDKLSPQNATQQDLFDRLSLCSGRLDKALAGCIAGFSSVSAREIAFQLTGTEQPDLSDIDLPKLCARLNTVLAELPDLHAPVLLLDETGLPTDVFPFRYATFPPERQQPMASLSAALEAFYDVRDRRDRIQQRSVSLRRLVKTHMERSEKKLAIQENELLEADKMEDYRVMGELLTAQLHMVPRGTPSVMLPNYYTGETLEIPLDVSLTPAQNAQRYFKRYQKARAAARLAAEQKEKTLADMRLLEEALIGIESSETEDDLNDIRRMLTDAGFLKKTADRKKMPKSQRQSAPMRFLSQDGTPISVGKNALQNERLTLAAGGEDVWLHAKDMPGSHVIIHTKGGEISNDTLLTAARLAAFYCKAHGISVQVDYTMRKFVKKPSGTPVGFVRYTHQKTLLMTVTEAEIRKINQIK